MRGELVDDVVHRFAGLDQDDDGARTGEGGHEFGNGLGGDETAFRAVRRDEFVRAIAVAIVNRDAEAFSRRVARQVRAHGCETEDAEIGKIRHADVPIVGDANDVIVDLIAAYTDAVKQVKPDLTAWWQRLDTLRRPANFALS